MVISFVSSVRRNSSSKLPNPNTLRAEYDKLTQEKDWLYKEYGKLKKQFKQLDTLKANVDKILNVSLKRTANLT